jgi:hypothetical protein
MLMLQTTHKEQYTAVKSDMEQKSKTVTVIKGQNTISFAAVPSAMTSTSTSVGSETYANTHPRQKAITDGLVKMIADSMLPFQFAESKGFKQFMAIVEPKYNVPSRRTVTRKTVDKLQMLKDNIRTELDKLAENSLRIGTVHATTDLWSSRTLEPIIGVRFHYFDANFRLQVKTVAYRHFAERHTGENIATTFEQIVEEYGITASEMGYQVTDNARNMLKAFDIFAEHAAAQFVANSNQRDGHEEAHDEADPDDSDNEFIEFLADDDGTDDDDTIVLGSCRLPCTAHTLQLAIKDALKNSPAAVKIIEEASAVVVFFRRSLY